LYRTIAAITVALSLAGPAAHAQSQTFTFTGSQLHEFLALPGGLVQPNNTTDVTITYGGMEISSLRFNIEPLQVNLFTPLFPDDSPFARLNFTDAFIGGQIITCDASCLASAGNSFSLQARGVTIYPDKSDCPPNSFPCPIEPFFRSIQTDVDLAILSETPDAFVSVTVGKPVPEPASWALMIGGFGLAGAALRRRRALA